MGISGCVNGWMWVGVPLVAGVLFFPKAVSGGGSRCGLNSSLFIYLPCDPHWFRDLAGAARAPPAQLFHCLF